MAFPQTVAPVRVDIAPGANPSDEDTWAWERITSYVLRDGGNGINIDYGRRNEGSTVDAAECGLRLLNDAGRFSRFNPNSPYYQLIGPNTPLRVRWAAAEDTFTRSVSNDWGTADSGQAWTAEGTASDYSVTGTVGRHSVGSVNVFRRTVIPGPVDVDISVSIATSALATGAAFRAGLVARYTDISNHYAALVVFNVDQTIDLRIERVLSGSTITVATSPTGLTHVAGTKVNLRFQVLAQRLRAKVWQGTEPAAWTASGTNANLATGASIGCRSRLETGNTNALPVQFDFDDFTAEDDRVVAFIGKLTPERDVTGNVPTMWTVAYGILNRLQHGEEPLKSAIYREMTAPGHVQPVEYWPLEDGRNATSMASALDGGVPMVITGDPQLSSDDGFLASEALPTMATASKFTGYVRSYPITNEMGFRIVVALPAAGYAADHQIVGIRTSGTASLFKVDYLTATSGTLQLRADLIDGTQILSQTMVTGANGGRFVITGKMTQSGADVGWAYQVVKILDDGLTTLASASGSGGLMNGRTIGAVQRVAVTYFGDMPDTVVGHVTIANDHDALTDFTTVASRGPVTGWIGEAAGERIQRLCAEESIPFFSAGLTMTDTMPLGAQRPMNILGLLRAAEVADGGVLYELGGGLAYLLHTQRYNQDVSLTLDVDLGQVSHPLQSTDDDQQLLNDVTLSRPDGSSAKAIDQAHIDLRGRYDDDPEHNVATDDLLPDSAAWLVHLGTVDDYRWPRIGFDLARDPDLIPDWLGFRLGGRVSVPHSMAEYPGTVIDVLADGWSERISNLEWTAEVNATPAEPWTVGVLDDVVLGRADTDASELATAITTTTQTSFNVSITDGPLWTTDAAEFPFSITIDGEEMTLTNVTGAATPQTFTVTRAANGIAKTHAVGADVRLTHPFIASRS